MIGNLKVRAGFKANQKPLSWILEILSRDQDLMMLSHLLVTKEQISIILIVLWVAM